MKQIFIEQLFFDSIVFSAMTDADTFIIYDHLH